MRVAALTLTVLISVTVAVPTAVRQVESDGAVERQRDQRTVAENIRFYNDFRILARLVANADRGLTAFLSNVEDITLFAPTDTGLITTAEDLGYTGDRADKDAVGFFLLSGARGRAKRDDILPGIELAGTLGYHVTFPRMSSVQILQKDVESLPTILRNEGNLSAVAIRRSSEKPLALIDRAPAITDPNLIEGMLDIPSSNGVIHVRSTCNTASSMFRFAPRRKQALQISAGALVRLTDQTLLDLLHLGYFVQAIDRMLHSAPITEELFDVFRNPDGPQAADDVEDEPASSDSPDTAQSPDDPEESSAPVSGRSPGESGGAPDERDEGSACFSASATVHLSDGSDKPMHAVVAGDFIRHSTKETNAHSKVYAFSHRESAGLHDFVRIESESGHVLIASRNHYVYANGRLVVAAAVKEGDVLTTLDGPARVGEVKMVKEEGLYAPHTMHGDIVVDRVLASSYTQTLHPTLAYFILAPVRLVARMGVKEPLGKLLYEGADQIAEWVPAGPTYI